MEDIERRLAEVGPKLKALRKERGTTLSALSEATGISASTLSRLESGTRKATLELLLTLSAAHQVPLDELVGEPEPGLKHRGQRGRRLLGQRDRQGRPGLETHRVQPCGPFAQPLGSPGRFLPSAARCEQPQQADLCLQVMGNCFDVG